MMYAVMYRESSARDWEFVYWVAPGADGRGQERVERSIRGLLASEHACGAYRAQAGYISCPDDAQSEAVLRFGRPKVVKFLPGQEEPAPLESGPGQEPEPAVERDLFDIPDKRGPF